MVIKHIVGFLSIELPVVIFLYMYLRVWNINVHISPYERQKYFFHYLT